MYLRHLSCFVVFAFALYCNYGTCPVRPIMGLNVAVQHGRVRVRIRPGFRVRVSRVSRVWIRVSVRLEIGYRIRVSYSYRSATVVCLSYLSCHVLVNAGRTHITDLTRVT